MRLHPRRGLLGFQVKPQSECGATLLLALVFITVVSLLAIALVQLAGNDLTATVQFKNAQANQSATDSVTNVAIYQSRYNFPSDLYPPTTPQPCWGSSSATLTLNNVEVAAWCQVTYNPTSKDSRIVTIYSCLYSVAPTGSSCAAAPLTTAVVTFDDFPISLGGTNCIPGSVAKPSSTCGTSMTLNSWVDR